MSRFELTSAFGIIAVDTNLSDGFYRVIESGDRATSDAVPVMRCRGPYLLVNPRCVVDLSEVQRARANVDKYEFVILTIELSVSGGEQMFAATSHLVGQRIALVVDNYCVAAPVVRSPLSRVFDLHAGFSLAQACIIATRLSPPTIN